MAFLVLSYFLWHKCINFVACPESSVYHRLDIYESWKLTVPVQEGSLDEYLELGGDGAVDDEVRGR